MGIVYMIECLETGEKYVGSTKVLFKIRMSQHKTGAKKGKTCSSKQIIDRGNYKSYIVEEVEDDILREREQYHMDNTECINKKRAKGNADPNEEITCECGAIYKRSNNNHFATRQHYEWAISQNSSVS